MAGDPNDLERLIAFYTALGDPVRWELIRQLRIHGRLSLRELLRYVPDARAGMKLHLALLEAADLVEKDEDGNLSGKPVRATPTAEQATHPRLRSLIANVDRVAIALQADDLLWWSEVRHSDPALRPWQDTAISRDYLILGAKPDDMDELSEQLVGVIETYKEKCQARLDAEGPEGTYPAMAILGVIPEKSVGSGSPS